MASKKPQVIGELLGELFARRGYGRIGAQTAWNDAWAAAAGERFRASSRVAGLRRGIFEVTVANSTLLQELVFEKARLRRELAASLPDEKITDLRFRVGQVR